MITEKEFETILLKFLLQEPFFASVIRSMRKVRTEDISTAGVMYSDGTMQLLWSPQFLSSLKTEQIFGLLKHECYHLIFKHVTLRKQTPHINWNVATDCAINSIIPLKELPEGGIIPGEVQNLQVKEGVSLSEEQRKHRSKFQDFIAKLPKGKSSEWYMQKINEDADASKAIEELYGKEVMVVMDEHDGTELSAADKIIADQKIKDILKKAKETASSRGWGSVSYSARSEIDKIVSTKFSWERALKYFCGSKQRNNFFKTQRRINRKYPYIHPGRKSRKTSFLAVYIDQSGSVGSDSLSRFGKVLEKLSNTHTFDYYYFDAKVDDDSKTTWKKGKKSTFSRALTGGTNFDAVEDHFRKVSRHYDGYIVMTDGYASKPKNCKSKRCWVICPNGKLQFKPDKKDYVIKMNLDNQ